MPHLFQPYADTVARTALLAILVGPFVAIGIAYWISNSEYTTDHTLTLEQPVPFSHKHHVGGLGLDCAIVTPASKHLRPRACRRPIPA